MGRMEVLASIDKELGNISGGGWMRFDLDDFFGSWLSKVDFIGHVMSLHSRGLLWPDYDVEIEDYRFLRIKPKLSQTMADVEKALEGLGLRQDCLLQEEGEFVTIDTSPAGRSYRATVEDALKDGVILKDYVKSFDGYFITVSRKPDPEDEGDELEEYPELFVLKLKNIDYAFFREGELHILFESGEWISREMSPEAAEEWMYSVKQGVYGEMDVLFSKKLLDEERM